MDEEDVIISTPDEFSLPAIPSPSSTPMTSTAPSVGTKSDEGEEYLASTQNLLRNERRGILGSRDQIASPEVDGKMRSAIVNALINIYITFRLRVETFYAAINILDAVLARDVEISRDNLSLVSIAALSIASKYHELRPPRLEDLSDIASDIGTVEELIVAERRIFTLLGCNINVLQEMEYLRVITYDSGSDLRSFQMSKNLLFIVALTGTNFLPSVTTTAARKIAAMVYGSGYANHFSIPENIVDVCMYDIISRCKMIKTSQWNTHLHLAPRRESVNRASGGRVPLSGESIPLSKWVDMFNRVCELKVTMTALPITPAESHRSIYFRPHLTRQLLNASTLSPAVAKLGEGSFGVVERIDYQGRSYAVKRTIYHVSPAGGTSTSPITPSPTGSASPMKIEPPQESYELETAFLREVSIMLSLDHPNVAKIRHLTSDLSSIFLDLGITDFHKWIRTNGPLTYPAQIVVANQLFSALTYIHEMGCLHRDIKPANIIVYQDTTGYRFVLSDFGGARGCEISMRHNMFTRLITTLDYRAPEILLGSEQYTDAVDVWSMLCTIYYCAADMVLFNGHDEASQLLKIFQIMGTPENKTWPGVTRLPEYNVTFPVFPTVKTAFFNDGRLSKCYRELMMQGLVMDPEKRPRAGQLLEIIRGYVSQLSISK